MNLPLDFVTNAGKIPCCDIQTLLDSLTKEPVTSVRLHPLKKRQIAEYEKVQWCDNGIYLPERPLFTLDPLLHAGSYYVQEASSMLVGYAFRQLFPQPKNLHILDSCAAPGGKSTQIASLIDNSSLLISNEYVKVRASVLSENMQKWGYHNVVVTNSEVKHFSAMNGYFDAIIADVPCSGEGMFRKDETAIKEWSLDNVTMCAIRQKQIIKDLWPSLKENGILFYSTCTFNVAENEDVTKWICEELGAKSLPIPVNSEWGIKPIEIDGIHSLRCYPGSCKGEGFSLHIIQKVSQTDEISHFPIKGKAFINSIPSMVASELYNWVDDTDVQFVENSACEMFFIPSKFFSEIAFLGNHVKVVHTGMPIASLKGKDFIPHPAFAFSVCINQQHFNVVELSREQALLYFSKGTFTLPDASLGWILLNYRQLAIGFVKNIGNRINNSYPMEWRIRMDINGQPFQL